MKKEPIEKHVTFTSRAQQAGQQPQIKTGKGGACVSVSPCLVLLNERLVVSKAETLSSANLINILKRGLEYEPYHSYLLTSDR